MLASHQVNVARVARGALSIALFVGVWWFASAVLIGGGGGRLPDPVAVVSRCIELMGAPILWDATAVTFARGFAGLMAALVVSILLALLLARSRVANAALEPMISLLYPVPRIALYPVAVVALGIGAPSQISLVAIECVFPLTVTIYAGLRSIDRNLLWVARNVTLGTLHSAALKLRLVLPAIFTGLRIAAPLMLILTIAAQMFTGSSDGLGYLVISSSARLMTVDVFAISIFIGVLGYLVDQAIVFIESLTTKHQKVVSL